jgi:hypothetical protein
MCQSRSVVRNAHGVRVTACVRVCVCVWKLFQLVRLLLLLLLLRFINLHARHAAYFMHVSEYCLVFCDNSAHVCSSEMLYVLHVNIQIS